MAFPGIARRRGFQGLAAASLAGAVVALAGAVVGDWAAMGIATAVLLLGFLLLAGRLQVLVIQIDNARRSVESTQGIYHVLKPETLVAPTTDWSSSPAYLKEMTDAIREKQPAVIVECGGGHSTVVAGLTVRKERLTCGITVLEHQPQFAEELRRQVLQHGLSDIVRVVTAPLVAQSSGRPWYDTTGLSDLGSIDLVLVDGPPGFTSRFAREPVLEALRAHLSPSARVILDDTNRDDEREIVSRWQRDFGATVRHSRADDKGVVVLDLP